MPMPGEQPENGVAMPKAVRFEEYGGVNVLKVVDVPRPVPGPGQVPELGCKAAAVSPGEAAGLARGFCTAG